MKTYIYFYLFILLLAKPVFAQDEEEKVLSGGVYRANFTLQILSPKAEGEAEMKTEIVTKDIWFKYSEKGGESNGYISLEKISDESEENLVDKETVKKFIFPINYDNFQKALSALIPEVTSEKILSNQSVQRVFYWVITKTAKAENRVEAGKILVNQWVKIYTEAKKDKAKEKEIDEVTGIDGLKRFEKMIYNFNLYKKKVEDFGNNQMEILYFDEDKIKQKNKKISAIRKSDTISSFYVDKDSIKKIKDRYPRLLKNGSVSIKYHEGIKDTINKDPALDVSLEPWYSLEFDRSLLNKKLSLYNSIKDTLYNLSLELTNKKYFQVSSCQLQFEKGFLERIIVEIKDNDNSAPIIFENLYPIGFSSTHNLRNLSETKVFARNLKDSNNNYYYIYLGDIIRNYYVKLDLNHKDYSPGDTVVANNPFVNPIITLFKARSKYLLDTKAYTDISGLGEESPNGLVQLEASRRFNLFTYRYQLGQRGMNMGSMNYLNLQFVWSKLEQKKKELPLQNQKIFENGLLVSPDYATTLDFNRYENASLRAELNGLLLDIPTGKMTFYLDGGFKAGWTPLLDSIHVLNQEGKIETRPQPTQRNAYHFTFYPKIWMELFAEKRYGFSVGYQTNYSQVFSNDQFKQVLSYSGKGGDLEFFGLNRSSRWWHTLEFRGRLDTNPNSDNGKLFFLARFNWQNKDINSFFPQIQLGYAFQVVR